MGLNLTPLVFETEGLGASEKLVLLQCAYQADRKGVIRASQADIAALTGLSRRTVSEQMGFFNDTFVLKRIGYGRYQVIRDHLDDLPYWLGYSSKQQATTSRPSP